MEQPEIQVCSTPNTTLNVMYVIRELAASEKVS